MTVAVITDSAASLPADLAREHHVTVVPLVLVVDGTAYQTGSIPPGVLESAREITTASPSPDDFAAAIAASEPAEGAVVLTLASEMSSTHQSAVVGTRSVELPTRVIDTRTAAGAQGLVVLAAARVAAEGAPLEEVVQAARRAADEVRLLAALPSLDHLARSGRVPNVASRVGQWIGVAPLVEFRDGRAVPLRPAFSMDAALNRIVGRWRRTRVPDAPLHVAALHAASPERAERLLSAVRAESEPASEFVGEFDPVMVSHTGPGLAGLAWRWEGHPARGGPGGRNRNRNRGRAGSRDRSRDR